MNWMELSEDRIQQGAPLNTFLKVDLYNDKEFSDHGYKSQVLK